MVSKSDGCQSGSVHIRKMKAIQLVCLFFQGTSSPIVDQINKAVKGDDGTDDEYVST